ncbi:hypothetical protein BD414DRAFT_498030 [Trametes punicea]|nr:hypothetical protein BD414DRAFT_498030 [Trametes punicea]
MGSLPHLTAPYSTAPEAIISDEHVINISKEVIHSTPLICEWGQCHSELNSWKALQEHLHRHCQQLEPSSSQQGVFQCMIPKCSGRFHYSLHDLLQHIDLSHMSRVLLPCPVKGCTLIFGRNAHGLPEHFRTAHSDLFGRRATGSSAMFQPLRRPHPHIKEALPALPGKPLPAYILTSPAVSPTQSRCTNTRAPTDSQGGHRKQWKKMYVLEEVPVEEESLVPLPDLPPYDPHRGVDIEIRRKPLEPMLQQSRPQHMIVPSIPEPDPPVSIGYAAFAKRFMQWEKATIVGGIRAGLESRDEQAGKAGEDPARGRRGP